MSACSQRRRAQGLCIDCGLYEPELNKLRCTLCLADARVTSAKSKAKYKAINGVDYDTVNRLHKKLDAYELLGNVCVCCGEDWFAYLEVDHINNDGAAFRKNNPSGDTIIDWILKHGTEGLQLLCANCHRAKSRRLDCKHASREDR